MNAITLNDNERSEVPANLFGPVAFSMNVEPHIFALADKFSPDYHGGIWAFVQAENGAFYMYPDQEEPLRFKSPNGSQHTLSPRAFGITCCLFTYSWLSFGGNPALSERVSEQYQLLNQHLNDLEAIDEVMKIYELSD